MNLYAESAPVFVHFLTTLKSIIARARVHAAEQKFDENVLLTTRLYPDMFAFTRQVQIACDSAKGAVARLSGTEVPKHPDTEATFDELLARIDKTIVFIRSIDEASFAGAADRHIELRFGDWKREFKGVDFLRTWALPNFYFHLTTAYALLRHNGVPVGKFDFLG